MKFCLVSVYPSGSEAGLCKVGLKGNFVRSAVTGHDFLNVGYLKARLCVHRGNNSVPSILPLLSRMFGIQRVR